MNLMGLCLAKTSTYPKGGETKSHNPEIKPTNRNHLHFQSRIEGQGVVPEPHLKNHFRIVHAHQAAIDSSAEDFREVFPGHVKMSNNLINRFAVVAAERENLVDGYLIQEFIDPAACLNLGNNMRPAKI